MGGTWPRGTAQNPSTSRPQASQASQPAETVAPPCYGRAVETHGCPPEARAPKVLGGAVRYERRRPEETLLYQVVQGHVETFLELARDPATGAGLPKYVERELRAYLDCGIPAAGFARIRCPNCKRDCVLPFS